MGEHLQNKHTGNQRQDLPDTALLNKSNLPGRLAAPDNRQENPETVPVSWDNLEPFVTLTIEVQGFANEPIQVHIEDRLVIGRCSPTDTECTMLDLLPYDGYRKGVSREHAELFRKGHTIQVIDLASSNGTYWNGSQLAPYQPCVLWVGDQLALGTLTLTITNMA